MTLALYTNIVSPHQLPLAWEIVKRIGAENYRYIYTEDFLSSRSDMGWKSESEPWIVKLPPQSNNQTIQQSNNSPVPLFSTPIFSNPSSWLENCDVLLCCPRDIDLIERRCQRGLKTYYTNERWFKPIGIKVKVRGEGEQWTFYLPGWLRLFSPSYFRMARRFVKLVKQYDCFRLLPIGIHAYNDFLHLGIPKEKMTLWGYFVAPSEEKKIGVENRCTKDEKKVGQESRCTKDEKKIGVENRCTAEGSISPSNAGEARERGSDFQVASEKDQPSAVPLHLISPPPSPSPLRVLYVGRLIPLKRVDTIIRAIRSLDPTKFSLTLVGNGDQRHVLEKLANGADNIKFMNSLPIAQIRQLMREHDVYVLPSTAEEGWGAVVSEALEEGMIVLGSNQAGSTATILPPTQRFDSGDYKRLAELLKNISSTVDLLSRPTFSSSFLHSIGEWSAARAAERLLSLP